MYIWFLFSFDAQSLVCKLVYYWIHEPLRIGVITHHDEVWHVPDVVAPNTKNTNFSIPSQIMVSQFNVPRATYTLWCFFIQCTDSSTKPAKPKQDASWDGILVSPTKPSVSSKTVKKPFSNPSNATARPQKVAQGVYPFSRSHINYGDCADLDNICFKPVVHW